MSHKFWIFLIPLVIFGVFAVLIQPVAADSQLQVVYQTPTAQPDGRVLYKVVDGDSCLRIELLTGVKVETLRELNKLDQGCTINPGQDILLAVVTQEPTPTTNPDMTATPPLPTPTPVKGNGTICVMLFDDVNGNAVYEEAEFVMAGGAVSVSDRLGSVSRTGNTSGTDETLCFDDVPEGEYNISMGVPGGYNGTTLLSQILKVQAGETAILEFGAQVSSQTSAQQPSAEEPAQGGQNNTMLAVMGGILLLLGIGLGAYILFTRGK